MNHAAIDFIVSPWCAGISLTELNAEKQRQRLRPAYPMIDCVVHGPQACGAQDDTGQKLTSQSAFAGLQRICGGMVMHAKAGRPPIRRNSALFRSRRGAAREAHSRQWRRGHLVDEVADIRQDALTQVHTQQACTERRFQFFFKVLEHKRGQIGLPPKQAQQRRAIGWEFVVAG